MPIPDHLAPRLRFAVATAAILLATATDLRAGGGPENLFLVVNSRSWSSLTVANHYVRLRKVPITNVFYHDWPYDNEQVDADTFRTKLLVPVFEEINRRNIADHIDYVVYSTDFPWAVDCREETKGAQLSQYLAPIASINGLTFLYQDFLAKRYELLLLDSNKYYRPVPQVGPPESHGFHGWYGWGPNGRLLEAGGERYFLSAMLGVTSGRGMATADVVRNLQRSVGADYTRPTGTVYYAQTGDVRSQTRDGAYPAAVAVLKNLGVKAEIVHDAVPQNKNDVMGAMLGTESVSWQAAHSAVRPGAICEHLTSTGGVMRVGAGQTPLTENLLAGAAGASGAVTEPFAIPQKFPNAYLHVHYARGCSLAESFYQAVNGPYQLLIVGDPLCRPWADPPRVSIDGVTAGQKLADEVTLTPTAKVPAGTHVARFELYADGQFVDACDDGGKLKFDTHTLVDGRHELRVMAVAEAPIETRGGLLVPVDVDNHGRKIVLERVDAEPVEWGRPLKLRVAADEGAVAIVVAQGSRTLARIRGSRAEFSLDPRSLGLGPVTLQAASVGANGPASNAMSATLDVEVDHGPRMEFTAPRGVTFKAGMKLTQSEGEPSVILQSPTGDWLAKQGVTPGESFALSGFFTVDRDGEFQFQLRHAMHAELYVDDVAVSETDNQTLAVDYVPVSLKNGLHKVELRGKAGSDLHCDVLFGYAGLSPLAPAAMTHNP